MSPSDSITSLPHTAILLQKKKRKTNLKEVLNLLQREMKYMQSAKAILMKYRRNDSFRRRCLQELTDKILHSTGQGQPINT